MDLVSDDILFLPKVIFCSVSPGFRYDPPHPLALEVGTVFQAWGQIAELSDHGTSIASSHRHCSVNRMSAWNCWQPSWYACEDEANKEERKHRVFFSGTCTLVSVTIRLEYFLPALSSPIHPFDGQSSSLGPPPTCLVTLLVFSG